MQSDCCHACPFPQHSPSHKIITYEIAPQLLHLLQNPRIMTSDNLLIDLQNSLAQYQSPSGELGDALSGSVYRNAYKRLITNPTRELFVPIIQWIDRTDITGNGRFSLKPYMLMPAILNETFRRQIQAWGYHEFLPKSKKRSAQNKKNGRGDNMQNYHAELYAVLQPFTTAGPQLKNALLLIGPNGAIRVGIVTCILFIIQDMQEGDALCGQYGTHGVGIQRHCCGCNHANHADFDNPHVKCSYLMATNMADIASNDD
jgi:Plavaka transposase